VHHTSLELRHLFGVTFLTKVHKKYGKHLSQVLKIWAALVETTDMAMDLFVQISRMIIYSLMVVEVEAVVQTQLQCQLQLLVAAIVLTVLWDGTIVMGLCLIANGTEA